MSFDDVQIGKRYPHCGATKVNIPGDDREYLDQRHGISQNRDEYWVTNLVLDLGLRIDKHSKEGQKLKEMIESGKKLSVILPWLDRLVLRHVKVDRLYKAIQDAYETAIEEGMRRKQTEIIEALGIQGGFYV